MTTDSSHTDGQTVRVFYQGQVVLERYELRRLLGRGGMGVVWLAHDAVLDRPVALKFLPEDLVGDKAAVEELKREVRRVIGIAHPHIVKIHDYVIDRHISAISMEYVEGETLGDLRLSQPSGVFSPEQLLRWVEQLCGTLDYAHRKALIVHRDLKPANIIIDRAGDVKILDFGIAASISETRSRLTNRGTSGTMVYMSPQQLLGKDPVAVDDLYALGATLYEMLAGKPPFFRGDVTHQKLNDAPARISERRPAGASKLSPVWEQVISSLLAIAPEKRPQSGAEVMAKLNEPTATPKADLHQKPIGNTADSANEQAGRKPRWRKWAWAYAPAIIVLLAGSPLYYSRYYAPREQQRREVERKRSIDVAVAKALPSQDDSQRTSTALMQLMTEKSEPPLTKPSLGAPGSLIVETRPAGASASIDGTPVQTKTPFTLQGLKTGSYSLQIQLDRYEPYNLTADVKGDRGGRATIDLVRSNGTIKIESDPAGLEYELRGEVTRSGQTPAEAIVPTGTYEVVFRRADWADQTFTVESSRNNWTRAFADFGTGALELDSKPHGATVVLSSTGAAVGVTPMQFHDLHPGEHSYTLVLPGYENSQVNALVESHRGLAISRELKRTAPSMQVPWTTHDIGFQLKMLPVKPGTFTMGSPPSEVNRSKDETPFVATITKSYWLGQYDVTVAEFRTFVDDTHYETQAEKAAATYTWRNPGLKKRDDNPVTFVSWNDAMAYCDWINKKAQAASQLPENYAYTLPSETQWEYACRAGSDGPYAGEIAEMGWYALNSDRSTHPVGTKIANAWGFYDMHANVRQWCRDSYWNYPGKPSVDPEGRPSPGRVAFRMLRGGSWSSNEGACRSAARSFEQPTYRGFEAGFRVALAPIH